MNCVHQLRRGSPANWERCPADVSCSGSDARRRRALLRLDRELKEGDDKRAMRIVKQLQGKPFGLRGFGAAQQVPKKLLMTTDDLKLNGVDFSCLKPVIDSSVDSIQRCTLFASMEEKASANADEKIVLEEGNEYRPEEDYLMSAQHEAGHFLTAYMLGILPKEYKLLKKRDPGQARVGGRVTLVGFDFLPEVPNARVMKNNIVRRQHIPSQKKFNNFSCVIVGGLVADHLSFGFSKGLHADVKKLISIMGWLRLSHDEAEYHVRWAVTNTAVILHRHQEARLQLAKAMASDNPISTCISTIEDAISII